MTQFILTSDIERGVVYSFKVRAKNIHGWGEWSDQTQIKAAGPPYLSPQCMTENKIDGTILLSWYNPDNNSEDLTSQEIEIQTYDGDFLPDPTNCPTLDLKVQDCTFTMSMLTSTPYNLVFGDLVVARARTTNFYGTSQWSQLNTQGAIIKQVPTKMGPISVLSKTETEITLSWSTLNGQEATGNSEILAYNLYWDKGSTSQPNIKVVSTLDTEF